MMHADNAGVIRTARNLFEPATPPDMSATLLTDFTLLRFSGADAQSFLHGQLTCEVQALKPGNSAFGGYCSPKGRLLATFLLWPQADDWHLLLPAGIAEAIRKRLSMYILRARVKAEDIGATRDIIGLTGDAAAEAAATKGVPLPERAHQVSVHGETTLIALPGGRWLGICPRGGINARPDDGAWQAQDIACGIPWITAATQEQFVPQMVNLDRIGALSYSKGCYPGQEIVARTHYLGRLKQRMYRAHVDAGAQAGDKLYSDDLGDQASGMILDAAARPQGGSTVLAVLRVDNVAQTAHHLGAPGGPPLQLDTLPYALE